jgi:NADPH:quinone reductase-like Zn-dependent oxidoreductase
MAGQAYLVRLMGFGLRKPKNPVPGLDVAGTVVAVDTDATRFKVGDEVFGISRGSFAEFACAREDKLALKPALVTFEQAAVLGVSGLTALQALRDAGRLATGQHVLIIGASGGIGTYAVQIAKAFGAEVTSATTSSSTSAAIRQCPGCGGRLPRRARSSSSVARTAAVGPEAWVARCGPLPCHHSYISA